MNFSFIDMESDGLGLPVSSRCDLSDLNELQQQNKCQILPVRISNIQQINLYIDPGSSIKIIPCGV